jgi:RNA polymerase sigma-70 factor (ECF subfamily)
MNNLRERWPIGSWPPDWSVGNGAVCKGDMRAAGFPPGLAEWLLFSGSGRAAKARRPSFKHSAVIPAETLADGDDPAGELTANSMTDEVLAGDVHDNPNSFLPLYSRYYDRILNYSYRRTLDLETAQDLTSQTFLAAFEYLRRKPFVAPARGFRAWLYRIATNTRVSHWRKSARWLKRVSEIQHHFGTRVQDPPTLHSEEEERILAVQTALHTLPEKYRLVLQLRYKEELTFEEIAEIASLAESSVRSRISRALEMLRKRLSIPMRGHGHE